jgi:excisionase family DNA binding protein
MQPSRLLTTFEVAEYLAVPVSTIHRWRYVGEGPPAAKIGKHLRFDCQDLMRWVEEQKTDRSETNGQFR